MTENNIIRIGSIQSNWCSHIFPVPCMGTLPPGSKYIGIQAVAPRILLPRIIMMNLRVVQTTMVYNYITIIIILVKHIVAQTGAERGLASCPCIVEYTYVPIVIPYRVARGLAHSVQN